MTNSFLQYNKRHIRHILSSHINVYSKRFTLRMTRPTAITRTSHKWPTFVYWYMQFVEVLYNRKYFLSDSQKKYQTVSISTFVLEQKKSNMADFANLLAFLHTDVFPDQIKQTYDNTVAITKNQISFRAAELPFNIYNQSNTFQQIFSAGMQGIGFTLCGTFQTTSTPLMLFLFLFTKYLMTPTS